MKRSSLFLVFFSALFGGCSVGGTYEERGGGSSISVSSLESEEVMYRGSLPCNNCEAIDLEVLLVPGSSSFELSASYVNHPDNAPDENYSGVWSAIKGARGDSNSIVYRLSPTDGQEYFFMRLGGDQLELIDPNLSRFSDGSNLRISKISVANAGEQASEGVEAASRVRTAHECMEEFRVYEGGLNVENTNDYLSCIEDAERAYGGLEERLEPIEPGSSLLVNVTHKYHPGEMKLSNGMILRANQWQALQSFLPQKREDRDIVIDAFSRYWFGYDRFENAVKVEPLRYISGPYSQATYVSLRGMVKSGSPSGFRLVFKYYGRSWIFAERVRVNVDGENIDLGPLDFSRDHTDRVWEIASIPLSGQGRRVAQAIAEGGDVVIRFVGPQYYHDFSVPRTMKNDIKAMLEALSVI